MNMSYPPFFVSMS